MINLNSPPLAHIHRSLPLAGHEQLLREAQYNIAVKDNSIIADESAYFFCFLLPWMKSGKGAVAWHASLCARLPGSTP
jgi:hypothetical protein